MSFVKFISALAFITLTCAAPTELEREKRQVQALSQVTVSRGQCPGGASMGRACDAKRPWPQCPPQSYCYATNTVDIGPYYCCPVWSTYGAAWRPQSWFYPYYPTNPFAFPIEALRQPGTGVINNNGPGLPGPGPPGPESFRTGNFGGAQLIGGRKARKHLKPVATEEDKQE